ncbi:hypothetical protein JNUCC0626_31895 [Lentzea sp. JNUCC 0626]|uniref:hypothetical protein n=1 Tax=Lentzea sp. JNUCC 0626 TaxID=3367513 RepID=UPI003747F031
MLPEDLMLLFLDEVAGGVRADASSVEHALAGAALLLRRHVRRDVMARLEARGVLTVERTKVLGISSVRSHSLHKVFNGDKREMNARAKEIARDEWAGDAVKKAIRARRAAAAAASS